MLLRLASSQTSRKTFRLLLAAGVAMASLQSVANAQSPVDDTTDLRLSGKQPNDASNASETEVDDQSPDTATLEPLEEEDPYAPVANEALRENRRELTVDELKVRPAPPDEAPGIALGSFILRPAITETIGAERERTGDKTSTRTYLQSGFKGSLTSDWSTHELRIDAEGNWQKTLSGDRKDDPEGKIDANLRLDISNDTIANLKAGYDLSQEDVSDPNAIANAISQAKVHQFTLGSDLTHDFGMLRGTVGVDFGRTTYGPAQLANGTSLDQSDRNQNTVTLRGRLGYDLSPVLMPFVEVSTAKTLYDETRDSLGYQRDSMLYALKGGLAADFGEKLKGELAAGHALADFEDNRLSAIDAFTLDGNLTWSPQRGTDVEMGLKTAIEPSTTAGASGSVAYTANMALTQAIFDNIKGRLSASETYRDYDLASAANQYVTTAGAGVTWSISRSLDLNADVSWENTRQAQTSTTNNFIAGLGLTLKR
jgi:hypothetical protein